MLEACKLVPRVHVGAERVQKIIKEHTWCVYNVFGRGMREKDRMLLASLLAL